MIPFLREPTVGNLTCRMKLALAYITTSNREEALKIGRTLVENRLAACINVLEGMQSIYRWEGRIEEAHECVLIAKTQESLKEQLIAKVVELHSYSCPCVIFCPIEGGNQEYLDWIKKESSPS
jgi:periplasmic divalent cation tolerance protein